MSTETAITSYRSATAFEFLRNDLFRAEEIVTNEPLRVIAVAIDPGAVGIMPFHTITLGGGIQFIVEAVLDDGERVRALLLATDLRTRAIVLREITLRQELRSRGRDF